MVQIGGPASVGTTGHHGAHECRALGSAGVCSELCLCAAAGGAQDREEPGLEGVLEHGCGSGRSDSRPLRASGPGTRGWRASGGEAWAGAKRNAQSQPALARLLLRNALSGWGLPGHPLLPKGKPPAAFCAGDRLSGGGNSVPDQAHPCLWRCAGGWCGSRVRSLADQGSAELR